MKERVFFFILLAILLGLLLFSPSTGWKAREFFSFSGSRLEPELDLMVENEALRAKIASLEAMGRDIGRLSYGYPRAFIYSRYPFNFKSELLIDVGEVDHVSPGQAVGIPSRASGDALSEVVFLGKVERVFPESAVVATLFDSRLELAVRIGGRGIEALLRGGTEPKLTLITKDAGVRVGDTVYVASHPYPYGLAIGSVASVRRAVDGLFDEAKLTMRYDINAIRSVLVFTGP